MIVLDSSVAFALLDRRDSDHDGAVRWYADLAEPVRTTPLVLAEVDHLALRRLGARETDAFRHDVATGAYGVEWWPSAAERAAEVARRFADLGLSLTDASLVALAARLRTTRIATFDERHFRAVRPLSGGEAFTLLPRDAALA